MNVELVTLVLLTLELLEQLLVPLVMPTVELDG